MRKKCFLKNAQTSKTCKMVETSWLPKEIMMQVGSQLHLNDLKCYHPLKPPKIGIASAKYQQKPPQTTKNASQAALDVLAPAPHVAQLCQQQAEGSAGPGQREIQGVLARRLLKLRGCSLDVFSRRMFCLHPSSLKVFRSRRSFWIIFFMVTLEIIVDFSGYVVVLEWFGPKNNPFTFNPSPYGP